jgi:hypothetical protein
MSDVQFEEEFNYYNYNNMQKNSQSKLLAFLLNKGIAKNEKQANAILIIATACMILISAFLFIKSINGSNSVATFELSEDVINRLPQKVQDAISNKK